MNNMANTNVEAVATLANSTDLFTAKIAQVKAYATGMLTLKLVMSTKDIASLGFPVTWKETSKIVQIKLQQYEWDTWRSEIPDTFPRIFGSIQFTLDSITPRHLDADPTIGRNEDMDWLEGLGFVPGGKASGMGMLPEFDKLIAKKSDKPAAPKGF